MLNCLRRETDAGANAFFSMNVIKCWRHSQMFILIYSPGLSPKAWVSYWRPSGKPFSLYRKQKTKNRRKQKCSLWFGCVQCSSVCVCMWVCMCMYMCVYALHQAAAGVRAGLGPAASQENRRGSRWICLDLTLPTPLHPPGPPPPTFRPFCRVEGRQNGSLFLCVQFGGGGTLPHSGSRNIDNRQWVSDWDLCTQSLT